MLSNAYFLAKIGADTAENEQHFARVLLRPAVQARPDVRVADLAGRRLEVRGEENWQSAAKIVSSPPATTLRAATGIWYVNIASRL